jgi:hypothetical protein
MIDKTTVPESPNPLTGAAGSLMDPSPEIGYVHSH